MSEWDKLIKKCTECKRCSLSSGRTNVVIGRGNIDARLMLIGEGPGEQEDLHGLPFVGPAGKLLDILLSSVSIKLEDCYICNIVKCRPPDNRAPNVEEAKTCLPFLREQVKLVKPEIIVCMGATAATNIIRSGVKITSIRGEWINRKGYWLMPTFHPAALLRDPAKKALMFEDFKKVVNKLY